MKKVAVYFSATGAMDYPFTKDYYFNNYNQLSEKIREKGGEFYVVRGEDTYLGNGKFSQSWQFQNGKLIETGEIIIDAIYDKGTDSDHFLEVEEGFPVLNPKYINDVCTDKYKTYELFGEFCPKTILVNSEEELTKAVKEVPSEKKVIKPVDDEEGNGVFIGSEEYILNGCPHEFPMLVQEFLDSSAGVPGLIEGIHDFRIALLNGEVIFSFLRTPPEGELLANVARGGTLTLVDPEDIPAEFIEIAKKIDDHLKDYPKRFFGVDLALTPHGPRIIELNSRLGLLPLPGYYFDNLIEKLSDVLLAD